MSFSAVTAETIAASLSFRGVLFTAAALLSFRLKSSRKSRNPVASDFNQKTFFPIPAERETFQVLTTEYFKNKGRALSRLLF